MWCPIPALFWDVASALHSIFPAIVLQYSAMATKAPAWSMLSCRGANIWGALSNLDLPIHLAKWGFFVESTKNIIWWIFTRKRARVRAARQVQHSAATSLQIAKNIAKNTSAMTWCIWGEDADIQAAPDNLILTFLDQNQQHFAVLTGWKIWWTC